MPKPRNIILLVADSLRYDSMHGVRSASGVAPGQTAGARLPFASAHATRFTQARSGGCWTLPATASLFTGLMPHEHGADSQTREIRHDIPTLAEVMQGHGYRTHQITANVATTEIFGLDRGFDEIYRVWKHVPAQHRKIHEALVLIGKPRLRKKLFSPEFVTGRLSEDLEASKVWLQDTVDDVLNRARTTLVTNEKAGAPSFLFLNLMETHFPYHVSPIFETSSQSALGKLREIVSLYHLVNQTWLTTGRQPIHAQMLGVLRARQRIAWERLAPVIDAFCAEMWEQGNLVMFGSDHGDNFGEQGWVYHFSNVTDAGNRVPLYWLDPSDTSPRVIDTPVSTRDVYHALLTTLGDRRAAFSPLAEPERSFPVMQSAWYNNQGKTLDQFKYGQICLLEGGARWMRRRNEWFTSPPTVDGVEAPFTRLPPGYDPLEESVIPAERRAHLKGVVRGFTDFSAKAGG